MDTSHPTPETATGSPGASAEPVAATEFPDAVIHRAGSGYGTRIWILTGACLLIAIGLILSSRPAAGPEIRISFREGHGIRTGHQIQYRGIEIGTVTSVRLAAVGSDRDSLRVMAQLHPEAAAFAKRGSEFWIVRPQISLSHVTGLETVVGARYISAIPGDPAGIDELEFQGRESPLRVTDSAGIEISIHFSSGRGLAVGDAVRHREIMIGEVTSVELDQTLNGVEVLVRLTGSGAAVARRGTRFWIERPSISGTEIRGLETLLGGRYLAVEPGTVPPGDRIPERVLVFVGLDRPPAASVTAGGLELVLESAQRSGLKRGVPILYRGVPIGHVISVRLASDAASVEARAGIEPACRHLVRDNSVFWNSSGVGIRLGLDGVRLDADTLTTIIAGGVSMATPDEPGAPVLTGHRAECFAEPQDEWLNWTPHLPLRLGKQTRLPSPIRASLHWERRFVIRRPDQQSGWVLPIEGNLICGPANLLAPVAEAVEGQGLETAGHKIDIDKTNSRLIGNGLALLKPDAKLLAGLPLWPLGDISQPSGPVDCLIVTTGLDSSLSLDAHRLNVGDRDSWSVNRSVQLSDELHGAVVVSRADGKLIGILLITDGAARIARFNKTNRATLSLVIQLPDCLNFLTVSLPALTDCRALGQET